MQLNPSSSRTLFPLAVVTFLLPGFISSLAAQETREAVFPGERWETVGERRGRGLEAYGWAAQGLQRARQHLIDTSNTTGLVVVDGGRIVFQFGDIVELSYLASVRKSVLSILYGKYVTDGTIDLDKTLEEIGMDDIGGLSDNEKQATIRNLVTARSGIYHPASNGGDDLASAPERGSQQPGTYMLYNNWDFNAAGAAFEMVAGVNIYDSMQEQLAIPLQFQDWNRSIHRKSGNLTISRNPAYHFHLSTRDMARIGYLMLRKGRWGDKQLVAPEWIERISSVVTPLEEMNPIRRRDGYFGYGYMWWVWDGPKAIGPFEGAYTARGAVGQWITVMPAVDLVIAHKTNNIYQRTTSWQSWQRFMELMLESKDDVEMQGPYPWR